LLVSLGEPAHNSIITIFDNNNKFSSSMKSSFTGEFSQGIINNLTFDYTPCLHIKTFRVAEVYGESVNKFRKSILAYLNKTV